MALSDLSPYSGMPEYPDEYLVVEDQLGDTVAQDRLMTYLVNVLWRFYHKENWMVARNFDFRHPIVKNSKNLIVPDIAVFIGIKIGAKEQRNLQNWNMMRGKKPCAPWVFESSSPQTFENDIDPERKVRLYGLIGAQEYFAYDPNHNRAWPDNIPERLLGWRYDEEHKPTEIKPD